MRSTKRSKRFLETKTVPFVSFIDLRIVGEPLESPLDQALQRLKYWRQGGDSFPCKLFELMVTADFENCVKLQAAYPYEWAALKAWEQAESEGAFLQAIP